VSEQLISPQAERYALEHTSAFEGPIATAARWTEGNTSAPQMMSGLAEARLLEALIVVGAAKRVLEIGTFTAVGTLTMAAAVGPSGRVTTLERDPEFAQIARRHIDASIYADRIELILGDALDTLDRLEGPFDLVYIDAAKEAYPDYFDRVLPKLAGRGVIVADNMFRGGRTMDPADREEGTVGMREFVRRVSAQDALHSVVLTIGDGVLITWRVAPAG
jgi:caffeoyl-CoA O-methyltransferase